MTREIPQGEHPDQTVQRLTDELREKTPTQKMIDRYFQYNHLPAHLQLISKMCCDLAKAMELNLPAGDQKTLGMQRLMEAKDCFVRTLV